MTTVAFDGVTLAADGRITENDVIIAEDCQKLHSDRDYYYGMSGHRTALDLFKSSREEVEQGIKCSSPSRARLKEYMASYPGEIVLRVLRVDRRTKEAHVSDNLVHWSKVKAPFAIGTGAGYAKAAMMAGAKARLAVEIASNLDVNTGHEIVSVSVSTYA